MLNWVTNKIKTSSAVIAAIVNDKGVIDFNLAAPFPGPRGADWDGICGDAENVANAVLGIPVSAHPLIAMLESDNRKQTDIKKLSDKSFSQFIGMLENHRACGYLHSMDWQRSKWGTKSNACEPEHSIEAGTAQFDTAWSCPDTLLIVLSERFPEDEISVTYADEDIGCNCGSFVLKAGKVTHSEIAPRWPSMTDSDKTKWRHFAYQVKGYSAEEIAEREAEIAEDRNNAA